MTAAGALLSLAAYTHVTVNEQRQYKQQQEENNNDEVVPLVPISTTTTTTGRSGSSSSLPGEILGVDKGDDTVSTATSNSVSGDEEDALPLPHAKDIRDRSLDDSETTFV